MHNKYGEEIRTFDDLKEFSADVGGDALKVVEHWFKRYNRKVVDSSVWAIINPWREVKRLRAFIAAMRRSELTAAKYALDLYAENESLRSYKDFANGETHRFVPAGEYTAVSKELTITKEKLFRVSNALDEQMKEWDEYMNKQLSSAKKKRNASLHR